MTIALQAPAFGTETEALVLAAFRRAAASVPAYRTLLDEHDIRAAQVTSLASFSRLCPLLSKRNTFDRFALDRLSVGGALTDVGDVLTSSGHGGRFSFGVITRAEMSANAGLIDRAFDDAFGVKTRKTLAINCLPMGVGFSSECMTVATISVREDMAVALVEAFGRYYEQIVLCGDPMFMKRFVDYARDRGVDWSRYRVNVIIGEEIFGEQFRDYLAASLGLHPDRPSQGYIMSSFGVGELGLHLAYETPATIALRRAARAHPAFARELLGAGVGDETCLPMIFTFNPGRTFLEVIAPDGDGYGRMTTTLLDPAATLPLLRYQAGDVIRLLDRTQVMAAARRHDVTLEADLPAALLALRGREKEALPNGSHVGFYKDALYADPRMARLLTGACRTIFSDGGFTLHVQLAPQQVPLGAVEESILHAIPPSRRPARLVLWPYARFPFGMSLDYERKFTYFVDGEREPDAADVTGGTAGPNPT
jgi:phenylacetate-CoA ligase